MTRVKFIFTALLLVSVTGCTAEKSSSAAPGESEWGYKKLFLPPANINKPHLSKKYCY
jgi:hypothetical protein